MANEEFVKIVIPYFYEQPIEIYIQDDLIPMDLEMIRYKVLNCLASEKEREDIIRDIKLFLLLAGFTNVRLSLEDTDNEIIEFPILL